MTSSVIAILVGLIQGIFEWLPISSEGNIVLVLTTLGYAPEAAVGFSLYLHLGTALAATVYYRDEIWHLLGELPSWRPATALDGHAEVTFLALATLVSGFVGITAYVLLVDIATELAGGAFIAAIGVLLVATGLLQRVAGAISLGDRTTPGLLDALLVGAGQGLAILPGVSRSGTTVSALLLRGHDGETSFHLSFLLSIPAAVAASVLAVGEGALIGDTRVALLALAVSAVVGYMTIDGLLRIVRRVSFWAICVGLGVIAVVGGVVLWIG